MLDNETGSTIEKFTILITTSFIFFIFSRVSFVELSLTLLDGEKISIGGLALNILKQLNGLKLTVPLSSIVLANAIGLGATDNKSILCKSLVDKLLGSIEIKLSIFILI